MNKNILRRIFNRVLHLAARVSPGAMSMRPFLHRLRGVRIHGTVWIGDDVYIESEYPERVELQDGVFLGMRATILAHTKGEGSVVIEHDAFIGPHAVIICASGKTLRVGEGAVVTIGSVITSSVAPRTIIAPPRAVPIGKSKVPYLRATYQEFVSGLEPVRKKPREQ
jgi:acetyltransferase-like isoleucine patch superfamily enzyme